MKLNRLRKNIRFHATYGGSFKRFKRNLRASPDKGLSRVPARVVKREWKIRLFEVYCLHDVIVCAPQVRHAALPYFSVSDVEEAMSMCKEWFNKAEKGVY